MQKFRFLLRLTGLALWSVLSLCSTRAEGQILSLPANPQFQNVYIQSGGFLDFGSPGSVGDARLTHGLGNGLRMTGSAPTLTLGTGLVGDPTGTIILNSFSAALNRPLTLDAAGKKISLPSDLLIEGTSTSLRYWDGAAYRTGFTLGSGSGGFNLPAQVSPEKVTDGDFAVDPDGWILGADWTIAGGRTVKANTGVTTLEQNVAAAAGELYLLQETLVFAVTTGGVTPTLGGAVGATRTADGTYREYLCATGAGNLIYTPGAAASNFNMDNVSVKQVGTCTADTVALWVQDVNGVAGAAGLHIRDETGKLLRFGNGALYLGASGDTASAMSLTPSVGALTLAGGSLVLPTIYGGIAANDDITIAGTSHGTTTTSYVILQPSGGNVGIGTTAIGNVLPTGFDSDSGNAKVLEIRSASAGDTGLFLGRADGTTTGLQIWHNYNTGDSYFDNRYNDDSGGIRFRTKTAGTPVDALTILGTGNVGIGTTGPNILLAIGEANTGLAAESAGVLQQGIDSARKSVV